MAKPVIKWAGGKTKLLPELVKRLPSNSKELKYNEPFIGGGALGLYVLEHNMFDWYDFSDRNYNLIELYWVIKNDSEGLIEQLQEVEKRYNSHEDKRGFYDGVRKDFNYEGEAWQFIFLNKCGFNGLYRENKSGGFNVPWGKKESINLIGEEAISNLNAVSKLLNDLEVGLWYQDFDEYIPQGDCFLYLDPPYEPLTSNFTYISDDHKDSMLSRLISFCSKLDDVGHKFMLSNSYTVETVQAFQRYNLEVIEAPRSISRNGNGRKPVKEILVTNY